MRLDVPADRRGTEAQVQTQLERLVDAERVAVDTAERLLPDDVAFGAVRRKAAWIAGQLTQRHTVSGGVPMIT
jgi:hypothetical protein